MSDWVLNFPTLDIATLRSVHKSIDAAYRTFSRNYGDPIESIFDPLLWLLIKFEWVLLNAPWWVVIVAIAGICFAASRRVRLTVGVMVAFLAIGVLNMWDDTMRTLAIIFVATLIAIAIGIPLGIAMSRSDRVQAFMRPILDVMQTMPIFVYLIPVVMLFGLGKIPGLIAVVIYAVPPVIRLTNLGIRLVDQEVLEAADAFGAGTWRRLFGSPVAAGAPHHHGRCQPDHHDGALHGGDRVHDRREGPGHAGAPGGNQPVLRSRAVQRRGGGGARDRVRPGDPELRPAHRGAAAVMTAQTHEGIHVGRLYKVFGADPASVMPLVHEGISKQDLLETHGHVLGLRDINLEVAPRSIQVVMGLSGSGKSTLVRHINRLIDPTEGDVRIDGEDMLALDAAALKRLRRYKISMVFQRFALFPHRNVMDNVGYGLALQGLAKSERTARAAQWVERVGLQGYEESYPHHLSGGMQQRVGLARALATDADILLMDEAFSALDPLIRSDMRTLLLGLQHELHKTIVFVTHDLEEAIEIGDRIAILRDGEVVQNGDSQDIVLRPADSYIADFTKSINRGRVIRVGSIMEPLRPDLSGPDCPHDMTVEKALPLAVASPGGMARVVNGEGSPVGAISLSGLVRALGGGRASGRAGTDDSRSGA